MREIKFRIWNADSHKMIYIDMYNAKKLNDLLPLYEYSVFNLMQYTGLKDKNNKEIYDSDIIKVAIDVKELDSSVIHLAVVDFVGGSFVLKNKSKSRGDIRELTFYEFVHEAEEMDISFEVAGNIFENSELIKLE